LWKTDIFWHKPSILEFLLNLNDLAGAIYFMRIGFAIAAVTLIFEIFWHDCLQRLKWKMFADSIRKIHRRWVMRNIVAPHPIIQVQPRDLEEIV
jgi:hypothetical protein